MNRITLFVTTRARGTDLRIFHSLFVDRLAKERRLQRICVTVVAEEAHEWKDHPFLALGVELLVLPQGSRLEVAKQHILEEPGDLHIITDDDLSIRKRFRHSSPKTCSYNEVLDLMDLIAHYALEKGIAHGGLSACQTFNQALQETPDAVLFNTRTGGFHWYKPDVLRKAKIDYTMAPEAEDIFCQLTLLKLGFPNVQFWQFCYEQRTQAKGGCQTYRTLESARAAAQNLQRLFPDLVKLKEKYSKVWGGNVLAITAYYKRAAKIGGCAGGGANESDELAEDKDDEGEENGRDVAPAIHPQRRRKNSRAMTDSSAFAAPSNSAAAAAPTRRSSTRAVYS